MKRILTILSLSILLTSSIKSEAQTAEVLDSAGRPKVTISATIATQGVGLDLKYAPTPAFAARIGASVLPISGGGVYRVSGQPTDVDFDADFANAHLMLDWHPFLKESGLSKKVVVTAGVGYFWDAQGDVVVSYRGTYKYGDILIPSSDLGQLYGGIKWNEVAPYLGFGFENVFPKKTFNVGFAVGTYYLGEPKTTLTGTNYLTLNTSNQAQLQRNMSHYRFMPVVQINLNFGL